MNWSTIWRMLIRERCVNLSSTEVTVMENEDTVVLTPEEKDKILQEVPEEEQQDTEEDED